MRTGATSDDCGSGVDIGPTLTKDDAIEHLLSRAQPIAETETVPLADGLGRVLASPLVSSIDVPGWDNSAMDGYAVRRADVAACGGRLRVTQRIPAGAVGLALAPGTAARIFTGAPVPEGADAVVVQEVCETRGEHVLIPIDGSPATNIRRAGEHIRAGAKVLGTGTCLAPQHLGLAASVGITTLNVYRRLCVAVVSTGDELTMPGRPLEPGKIYDANHFTLVGLLQGLGCKILDLGIVRDSLADLIAALSRGKAGADLVLASGGVSVGEEDHVGPALRRLGALDLWGIALRPGKPVAFGRVGKTPFFGCPGNPVALFVTFFLFVRPVLLRMQGVSGDLTPPTFRARASFDWPKPAKRREFLRARIRRGDDGIPEAIVFPHRSSAMLSSVAWADGLLEIPEGRVVRRGELVDFLPLQYLAPGGRT